MFFPVLSHTRKQQVVRNPRMYDSTFIRPSLLRDGNYSIVGSWKVWKVLKGFLVDPNSAREQRLIYQIVDYLEKSVTANENTR